MGFFDDSKIKIVDIPEKKESFNINKFIDKVFNFALMLILILSILFAIVIIFFK